MYLDQVKSMYAEYAGNDIFQASTKNGLTYQGNYQGVIYTSSHGLLYIRSAKFIEGKTGDVLGEVCGFEGNFYKK